MNNLIKLPELTTNTEDIYTLTIYYRVSPENSSRMKTWKFTSEDRRKEFERELLNRFKGEIQYMHRGQEYNCLDPLSVEIEIENLR